MTVFGNYARYYNLLYQDKDYRGEAEFVHQILQTHAPGTKTILELGCGTGNHAIFLANQGYEIYGVDLSPAMLQQFKQRISQLPDASQTRLTCCQGDIRDIRLDTQFDAIISLFHVMSYQTSSEDVQTVLATIKAHLKPGGICIFDYWYGPAVLTECPAVRVKHLENDEIEVTRLAEPVMHPNENVVDVRYHVFIKEKQSGTIEELHETHCMKYLFLPELELLLKHAHLEPFQHKEWLTNRSPGCDTWGVYSVVRN